MGDLSRFSPDESGGRSTLQGCSPRVAELSRPKEGVFVARPASACPLGGTDSGDRSTWLGPRPQSASFPPAKHALATKVSGMLSQLDSLRSPKQPWSPGVLTDDDEEEVTVKASSLGVVNSRPFSLRRARTAARAAAEEDLAARALRDAQPSESQVRTRRRVAERCQTASRVSRLALKGLVDAQLPVHPRIGLLRRGCYPEPSSADPAANRGLPQQVLSQLRAGDTVIKLDSMGLGEAEVVVVLSMVTEHTTVRQIELGNLQVTPRIMAELRRLGECGALCGVRGGFQRDKMGGLHPLKLSPHLAALLRRNAVAAEAGDSGEQDFLSLQRERRFQAHRFALCAMMENAETDERRKLLMEEVAKWAGLVKSCAARGRFLRDTEIKRQRMEKIDQALADTIHLEGVERPAIEAVEWAGRCVIVDWRETRLRGNTTKAESEARHGLLIKGYSSWETHRKLHRLRSHRELIERKGFGCGESQSRLVCSREEAQQRAELLATCEESWAEVRKVQSQREAKAEEERRKEQSRQLEEERDRQWKRDRSRKEQERAETDKQRGREKIIKDEKRMRGVYRKSEETVRGLLHDAHIATYNSTLHARTLGAALSERAAEVSLTPNLVLNPSEEGHHIFFFQGTEGWIPILPREVAVSLGMPDGWCARVSEKEEKAFKAAKAELQSRLQSDRVLASLLQTIKRQIEDLDLQEPEGYSKRLLSGRCVHDIRRAVLFPPVEEVENEKVRVWGGRVHVRVETVESGTPTVEEPVPGLESDLIQLAGGVKMHSESGLGSLRVYLPGTGSLRPADVREALKGLEYTSTCAPTAEPFARSVDVELSLSVYNLTDTTPLIDYEASLAISLRPGSPAGGLQQIAQTHDVDRPVPAQTVELSTTIRTFICLNRPYLSMPGPDGLLGTEDAPINTLPLDLPRVPTELTVPAQALYPLPKARLGVAVSFTSLPGPSSPSATSPQRSPAKVRRAAHPVEARAAAPGRKGVLTSTFQEREHTSIPLLPRSVAIEWPPGSFYDRATKKLSVRKGDRRGALMTNFQGGRLCVVYEKGFTSDDILVLADEGAYDASSRYIFSCGTVVGRVTEDVTIKKNARFPGSLVIQNARAAKSFDQGLVAAGEKVEALVIDFGQHEVTPGQLQGVLGMLRFSNPSKNPAPGARRMLLELLDGGSRGTSIRWHINVKWTDCPPELKIEDTRLLYRPASHTEMPPQFLQYFERNKLLVAAQGKLYDVDTERFCGGHMNFKLTPGQGSAKTDGLGIIDNPEPAVGISVRDYSDKLQAGQPNVKQLCFNAVPCGRVTWSKAQEGDEGEPTEITVDFVQDGNASIEAAQGLLRAVYFYSTELQHVGTGTRTVDLQAVIGPTMLKRDVDGNIIEHSNKITGCLLSASVQIRGAAPLIKVPLKHITLRYFEGSGLRRLGPFDLIPEEDYSSKEWAGGYLKAEIIENAEEEDSIKLQEGHGIKTQLISEADADAEHPDLAPDWRRRRSSVIDVEGLPQPEVVKTDDFASFGGGSTGFGASVLGGSE
eukprot:Hpha_TRINITY_DN15343_c2_g10::TRINITY_DN15343_c2_g10_i1::g.88344::m.88344